MRVTAAEPLALPSGLVRIGRECGVEVERLRADNLLREAQDAWSGDAFERWDKWLREAAGCLSLPSRVADLTIDEAIQVAENGGLVAGGYEAGQGLVLLVGGGRGYAELAVGELKERVRFTRAELAQRVADSTDADGLVRWILIDHKELSDVGDASHPGSKPIPRLLRLLRPEWGDIWIILVFAFVAGVLSLATPIAVESLVSTVAFGQLLQPVLVLATLLFGFLAFAGIMSGIQTFVVEFIQRRLFARVSADLAFRLPRIEGNAVGAAYGPELANRFLDVVTVQKVVAQLLTDGVSIVLATLVGMTVLAFYHPWLLGFDVLLLLIVIGGLYGLGRGAIPAAIKESKLKYGLTAWFEDLMRCPNGFKAQGAAEFASDRASGLTSQYLGYRRDHFTVIFRQIIFVLGLQAVAGTILLGGGGWLVIQGQLSLGQLVAAELIVATILGSLAKLGKHLEGFYDVVAAVDKLGVLFDLQVERLDGVMSLPEGDAARLQFMGLKHPSAGKTLRTGLDEAINAGEKVAVCGPCGSGKTTLLRILYGCEKCSGGHLEIEGIDPRDLRPDVLRHHVAYVGEPELFTGTIADNVNLHRRGVGSNDVRTALFAVGLLEAVLQMPEGLDTPINAGGGGLSMTQQRLLMIARAIADHPRLLLIDGTLDALPDDTFRLVHDTLTSPNFAATVIVATGREGVAKKFDRVIRLEGDDSDTGFVPTIEGDPS